MTLPTHDSQIQAKLDTRKGLACASFRQSALKKCHLPSEFLTQVEQKPHKTGNYHLVQWTVSYLRVQGIFNLSQEPSI